MLFINFLPLSFCIFCMAHTYTGHSVVLIIILNSVISCEKITANEISKQYDYGIPQVVNKYYKPCLDYAILSNNINFFLFVI